MKSAKDTDSKDVVKRPLDDNGIWKACYCPTCDKPITWYIDEIIDGDYIICKNCGQLLNRM